MVRRSVPMAVSSDLVSGTSAATGAYFMADSERSFFCACRASKPSLVRVPNALFLLADLQAGNMGKLAPGYAGEREHGWRPSRHSILDGLRSYASPTTFTHSGLANTARGAGDQHCLVDNVVHHRSLSVAMMFEHRWHRDVGRHETDRPQSLHDTPK